ncbi:MAG: hypothetical protein IKW60_01585 [Clostridia bacterium]|nr:hypothetical protein [Clostridia bacterium]
MVKKVLRSLLLGILVFALSIASGCLAFVLTYRYQTKQMPPPSSVNAQPVSLPALPSCTYLVRLENGALSVYARFPHGDEFLYALEVPLADIPPEDRVKLEKGMMLPTKEALTSLEEDYTG